MAFTEKGTLEELEKAKTHLQPGEVVIEWSYGIVDSTMMGNKTRRNAIVMATDRRIVLFVPKMFGTYDLEEFPYSTMSSIEMGRGMLGYTATFIASGNKTKIDSMQRGNPEGLIHHVRAHIGNKAMAAAVAAPPPMPTAPPPMPVPPPMPSAGDDFMAKLERLADLHTKGLLTADEFQAAKAKLLQ